MDNAQSFDSMIDRAATCFLDEQDTKFSPRYIPYPPIDK